MPEVMFPLENNDRKELVGHCQQLDPYLDLNYNSFMIKEY